MAYIIKCDRCAKIGGQGSKGFSHVPKDWRAIGLTVKTTGGTQLIWHQFCPECVEHLSIDYEQIDEETSAEKLVAILESMVDEAVNERDV